MERSPFMTYGGDDDNKFYVIGVILVVVVIILVMIIVVMMNKSPASAAPTSNTGLVGYSAVSSTGSSSSSTGSTSNTGSNTDSSNSNAPANTSSTSSTDSNTPATVSNVASSAVNAAVWSDWGDCKDGQRARTCNNTPPLYSGICIDSDGYPATVEAKKCEPVNGGWSDWGNCTDLGLFSTQSRTCNNPLPLYGGTCIDSSGVIAFNESRKCPPVDGGWSDWGKCIGLGRLVTQSRLCNNPSPKYGGTCKTAIGLPGLIDTKGCVNPFTF